MFGLNVSPPPPQTILFAEEFQPYVALAKQVMEGQPIPELESVRQDCNAIYVKNHGSVNGYLPTDMLVSFCVDAENRILCDQRHPDDVYSEISDNSSLSGAEFRQKSKRLTQKVLSLF